MFTHYTNVADIVKCPPLRMLLLLVCGFLCLFSVEAQNVMVFQLVVPPELKLGDNEYITYDYKTKPNEQKPYKISKMYSEMQFDNGWLATFSDYKEIDDSQMSREEFYNDCIWTSNVVVWTQMPLEDWMKDYVKDMTVEEFGIYVNDDDTPVIDLTAVANDIIARYLQYPNAVSLSQQIIYVLQNSALNRTHDVYMKFRASASGKEIANIDTKATAVHYMHTFPAVRFREAVNHQIECVSGQESASDDIVSSFAGQPVVLGKDNALEHEYSIEVGITDGNNIDPAILADLEPMRNTVVTLTVNGQSESRNIYFHEYNNLESAIKLSHCDPNNFLTVNEDGSYTPIANEMTIETSFKTEGIRVFGIAGPQGDDARRDRIDLTIPESHIEAPKFSPYAYRANKETGENQYVQRVAFAVANLDMTGDQTSLAGSALACSPQISYLPLKVDGELLLREDDPGLLYSSAFLDDIDCIAVLGESQPFHWFAEMDETNMMGVDKYDVSLAYTYLFRTGRIIGSAVGAITFDKPGEQPAAAPAQFADAETVQTHSTFTTHYTTMPVSINDMLTSADMVPESAVTVRTGAGWLELDGDAVVYDVAGAMVARGAGRHSLSSGIYVVCLGGRRVKTIIR